MAYKSHPFMDNAIALRLLAMLTTPFKEMDAFKSGVIDENGRYIVKPSERTAEQKKTLTYLDKLIINVKKAINRLPGGENSLKNIVSAMILIRENLNEEDSAPLTESNLNGVFDDPMHESDRARFIRSWCDYLKLKEEVGTGAIVGSSVPANNTSGVAFRDAPMNKKPVRRRNARWIGV